MELLGSNFGSNFGRGRVTHSDEVVAVSNQETASEITPSLMVSLSIFVFKFTIKKCSIVYRKKWCTGYHSFSRTGKDIIEASISQFNKKKKEPIKKASGKLA